MAKPRPGGMSGKKVARLANCNQGDQVAPDESDESMSQENSHPVRIMSGKVARPDSRSPDGRPALDRYDDAMCEGSSQPVRILVVDDDPTMRNMVVNYLDKYHMRAVSASGRQEMTRHFAESEPNLIILDLRLGEEDGLDLLREIRSRSDVPVIITTGHRRDEIDRVVGLELGADDYVTKPFGLRELLARIRAVLRRRESAHAGLQRDAEQGRCRFGGWELNRRTRRLTDPAGNPVTLTKGEYAMLIAFLDAPQRPLSREYLLQATRVHEDIFDRSVDVQVLRLRRKLEIDPSAPRVIRTERGVGYVFALPVERP
jgi:two-component system, OmpR family, response regulator